MPCWDAWPSSLILSYLVESGRGMSPSSSTLSKGLLHSAITSLVPGLRTPAEDFCWVLKLPYLPNYVCCVVLFCCIPVMFTSILLPLALLDPVFLIDDIAPRWLYWLFLPLRLSLIIMLFSFYYYIYYFIALIYCATFCSYYCNSGPSIRRPRTMSGRTRSRYSGSLAFCALLWSILPILTSNCRSLF